MTDTEDPKLQTEHISKEVRFMVTNSSYISKPSMLSNLMYPNDDCAAPPGRQCRYMLHNAPLSNLAYLGLGDANLPSIWTSHPPHLSSSCDMEIT
jgi:hypothetical protein